MEEVDWAADVSTAYGVVTPLKLEELRGLRIAEMVSTASGEKVTAD